MYKKCLIFVVLLFLAGCTTSQVTDEDIERAVRQGRQQASEMLKAEMKAEGVDPKLEGLIEEVRSPSAARRARAAREIGTVGPLVTQWASAFGRSFLLLEELLEDHTPIDPPGTKYYEYFPLQEPPWKLYYEVQSDFEAHSPHAGSDSSHHSFFFNYHAVSLRDGTNYSVPAGFSIPVLPNFLTTSIGIKIEDYFIDPEIPGDFKVKIEKIFLSNPPTGLKPPGMFSVSASPVLTDPWTIKFIMYVRCGPPRTSLAEQALKSMFMIGKPMVDSLFFHLPLRYNDYVKCIAQAWEDAGVDVDPKIAKQILSIKGWRLSQKEKQAQRRLLRIVPKLISYLTHYLKDESSEVRSWAAWNLGRLAVPETAASVPALSEMLNDDDADVRHSAAEALKKITGKDFAEEL